MDQKSQSAQAVSQATNESTTSASADETAAVDQISTWLSAVRIEENSPSATATTATTATHATARTTSAKDDKMSDEDTLAALSTARNPEEIAALYAAAEDKLEARLIMLRNAAAGWYDNPPKLHPRDLGDRAEEGEMEEDDWMDDWLEESDDDSDEEVFIHNGRRVKLVV